MRFRTCIDLTVKESSWIAVALQVEQGEGNLDDAVYSTWEPIRWVAAGRADLTDKHIHDLINDESIAVRIRIAQRSDLTCEHVEQLSWDTKPSVLAQLAIRHTLSAEQRKRLALTVDEHVLTAIGENEAANLVSRMHQCETIATHSL
ncbi:hypothetical protein BOCO_0023 [Bombiscardovia coagulans]|uniref:Uncharacterized protein n=1 Tax=Bombiscardovia coagulans TaxID=686666 RepID=A0A261EVI3_9BIFI|nr:hypothetical protein BOCO_0023 [Bombiscardovia coagulans]